MNIEDLSPDYCCHRLKARVELHREELQDRASESEELKLLTLWSPMKCFLIYHQQLRAGSLITREYSLKLALTWDEV